MDKVGVQNASLLDDETPQPTTSRHELAAIPQDRWESLRTVSAARGLSRNDLLVTAALRAAVSWRASRGKPERAFRVLFPVDLRAALSLPVCYQNFVGVIRSDFSAADAARAPDALARLVSERVREGRTLEEAIETPTNLGFLSAVLPPWAFRTALRTFDADPRSFFFSFLWSNIRVPELTAPPGLTIERVWIRGSLTRQPGFGLVVTADGRQVNVALEYLVPLASAEGVRDYRDRFLAELAALVAA